MSLKTLSEKMRKAEGIAAERTATNQDRAPVVEMPPEWRPEWRPRGEKKLLKREARRLEQQTGEPGLARAITQNSTSSDGSPTNKHIQIINGVEMAPVHVARYMRKVERKAAQLTDLMTEEDVHADLRVIREAREAVHYLPLPNPDDPKGKPCLQPVPDHKTRLAAAQFSTAHREGTPIARQLNVNVDSATLETAVSQLRSSPEAQRVLALLGEGPVIDADVQELPPSGESSTPE